MAPLVSFIGMVRATLGTILNSLFLLSMACPAFAAQIQQKSLIHNYQQVFNMPVDVRAEYLTAIRQMLLEASKLAPEELTASARSIVEKALYFFIEHAVAAESSTGGACIYAGFVSHVKVTAQGKLVCTRPQEINGSCQQKGWVHCNPALFGDVCVAPGNGVTRDCFNGSNALDVSKKWTSQGDYREHWVDLHRQLDLACNGPLHERQNKVCSIIKKRMSDIQHDLPNLPKPTPEPVTPSPAVPAPSVAKQTPPQTCRTDRTQFFDGTCHAFCLTCIWDQIMARQTSGFYSSANWMTLLSLMPQMCKTRQPANYKAGADPAETLDLTTIFGVCDEQSYIHYSYWEPPNRTPKNGDPNHLFQIADRQKDFRNWYGLDIKEMLDLFCPEPGKGINRDASRYKMLLENIPQKDTSAQLFVKCAKEALQNAERFTSSELQCKALPVKNISNQSDEAKIQAVKERLKSGLPIAIDFKTKTGATPAKDEYHCVSVVGVDDQNQVLKIINSGGRGVNSDGRGTVYTPENPEAALPYKNNRIRQIFAMNCSGSAFSRLPAASSTQSQKQNSTGTQ